MCLWFCLKPVIDADNDEREKWQEQPIDDHAIEKIYAGSMPEVYGAMQYREPPRTENGMDVLQNIGVSTSRCSDRNNIHVG